MSLLLGIKTVLGIKPFKEQCEKMIPKYLYICRTEL